MDLESIRKNIYHSYNEEYLKKIYINTQKKKVFI